MSHEPAHFKTEELLYILSLSTDATAIYRTEDIIIEFANDAMMNFWAKGNNIIGQRLERVLPELEGQPFIGMLQDVWRTGKTITGTDTPAVLNVNGQMVTSYFDFIYRAILDKEGKTFCILHTATDVTERYKNQQLLNAGQLREKNLNEELAAINEELLATNDELADLNQELNTTINELQQSQTNLQLAIESAKMGTWAGEYKTNKLILSERSRAIHCIPDGVTIGFKESRELVEPEDLDKILLAIETAEQNKTSFEGEYRINPMDGSPQKWLRSSGKVIYDADGTPLKLIGVFIDITERKLDDFRKNDFIAMASHELKTPLTTVKAFIETAKLMMDDSETVLFLLGKADAQTNKMTMLINSFLHVSSLDAGKIELHKTNCNLAELLDGAIKDIAVLNDKYQLQFLPCKPVFVYADCEKISQVIINLISNAIKYSPAGKTIEISCEQKDDVVQVEVKDEGIGIDPNDINRIFDRFYRVSGKHNKTVSGFGIGLYLCAEIIKQHKGKIWAESEANKGSSFYFTLPVNN